MFSNAFIPKVLLVNDEPLNLMIFEHLFKAVSATTTRACDGLEACKKTMNHKFDLVVMDLHMPFMDGFQATKTIKSRANSPYVVAFTSSEIDQELVARLKEAGFDDWFTLPVTQQVISQQIISKLRRSTFIEEDDQIYESIIKK